MFAHAQVIIAKRQRVFQDLVNSCCNPLRLVLPCEAQEVLYDAVRALRLFVEFVCVLDSLLPICPLG